MTGIKTLADALRESIRNNPDGEVDSSVPPLALKAKTRPKPVLKQVKTDVALEQLFTKILDFELGDLKVPVRLDTKTAARLRQLKIAKGIDMNKLIAFSLDQFLKSNPVLLNYIKNSLNNLDL